ncbi:4-(cytidine 5'-diphospho)-2-C-methyl-D-erythritol kinase [Actinomyces sp. B33]|uniref:4-(cytidine 5'-diphospho)-2-C-methyl-D-erythritol kinase n=1 Tax=Actinomyces sp. B33 TaxID=2942131 RepID=UPI0023422474|nr:4-(cytidine 5'-diphospho)-2-C-methyl-D-erythritol kinase [Actinomyces sp. B33]MDC4233758.1 4-(cytidine 5'-diphospho)-2-C-methyl-D-erythritol kinase [Actinomyces sp. B33]
MREVVASAPGKVNLTLRVGPPGADGFHPLVTVFEALDVRETVAVRTSRTPGVRVETTAYLPDGSVDPRATDLMRRVPDEHHLAVRAVRVMQRLAAAGPWAHTAAGVSIRVDKRVPVAGGMAGGSADAAAALVACNALWGIGLDAGRLEAIGRTLGADVPACLVGGIALGTGRGDRMEALADPGGAEHHWAIVLSDEGLSTPEVFRALDEAGGPGGRWSPLVVPDEAEVAALTGPAEGLADVLVNDLTGAALSLRPRLDDVLRGAREAGALAAVVSGSGPTVAALARDADHARGLAAAVRGLPGVRGALAVSGPAPGARVESDEAA